MPDDAQPVRAHESNAQAEKSCARVKNMILNEASQKMVPLASRSQTFDEIMEIINSYRKPTGIKLQIDAGFWGEDFSASAVKASFTGVIDRWQEKDKKVLMVKWEGYNRCQAAPIDKLNTAANGDSLNLKLLPFENGNMPTKQAPQQPRARRAAAAGASPADAGADDEEMDDEPQPTTFDSAGLTWFERAPN